MNKKSTENAPRIKAKKLKLNKQTLRDMTPKLDVKGMSLRHGGDGN